VTTAALVIQHDGSLVLAVEARGARSIADGLRRFAILEKCPGAFHHYRLTRHSLWNAAAAGITAERIGEFLERASGMPVPATITQFIASALEHVGQLTLVREGGLLRLQAHDPSLLLRLAPDLIPEFIPAPDAVDGAGFTIRPSQRGSLKARLARVGWPVQDRAGYLDGLPLALTWRPTVQLRHYQRAAIDAFSAGKEGTEQSGLIILPCGAGKTLIGVGASVALGQHTLILCPNTTSVQQWVAAYHEFTESPPGSIGEYSSHRKAIYPVTVTTYQMLTARGTRSVTAAAPAAIHLDRLGGHDWGLIIFDEAHLLPADVFRLAADLAARRRLGLTATPIREDGRETDLAALIGPTIFDLPWSQLEAEGWIAPVECAEIRVPLGLGPADNEASYRSAATAPEKWPIVRRLVRRHQGEGILVIGQYLDQLRDLALRLDSPLVTGETPRAEREALFARFRADEERILVLSRVGNAALDLPNARVAIEVSGNYGSRQEEAQRLGRLLRPKAGSPGPAHFYTIVADHPIEAVHAARRQRFLVEQGYQYRIIRAGPGRA
jgi:DNA excision repair protein ERCC-3